MKYRVAALAAAGILAVSTMLDAQTEAESLLAGATSLTCTFPVTVRTTWKDGVPEPVIRRTGALKAEIINIKAESGSAVAVTGNGNKDITMIADDKNRYFLDAGGGRVTMTIVLGEFSTGTKLKATRSIQDYVALDLAGFSAQPDVVLYAGDCEATP